MSPHLSLCSEFSQDAPAEAILLDGANLSIAHLHQVALYGACVELASSRRDAVERSAALLAQTVAEGETVYGVSTGFGASASKHVEVSGVQRALQGLLYGVVREGNARHPASHSVADIMPSAWVRGAMLLRVNSLLRAHSSVRWQICTALRDFLNAGMTPIVPAYGSISASGDLSPLAYIAFTLAGHREMRVSDESQVMSSIKALARLAMRPFTYSPKEVLAITNGTSVSASVAGIALAKSHTLALLSHAMTALNVQALIGTSLSFDPFLHDVARPHPGQTEVAANIRTLLKDARLVRSTGGHLEVLLAELQLDEAVARDILRVEQEGLFLKQDRYALRTSPQWLGPPLEDLVTAHHSLTIELNSTTDNPIGAPDQAAIIPGGNFQACSVTSATEKNRSALASIGRLIFAQSSELINPTLSQGLPGNLVPLTEPGADGGFKGVEIGLASYTSELAFLANNVSHFVQSAEQHNQSVNSLALISARQTLAATEVLTKLLASALLMSVQALDLRAHFVHTLRHLDLVLEERLLSLQNTYGCLRTPLLISFALTLLRHDLRLGAERAACVVVEHFDAADIIEIAVALRGEDAPAEGRPYTQLREALHGFLRRETDTAQRGFTAALLSGAGESPTLRHLSPATAPLYRLVREELDVPFYVAVERPGAGMHSMGSLVGKVVGAIESGRMLDVLLTMLGGAATQRGAD